MGFKETIVHGAKKLGRTISAKSPTIMVVGGTIALVAAGVLACKQTRSKLDEVISEHKEKKQALQDLRDGVVVLDEYTTEEYAEKYYKKHLTNLYLQTVCKLAKVYALPLLLAAMGITSIFAGHRILSVRHLKAVADTFAVREAFSEYRGRVADRIGAEEEKLLYLNGEKAIVTDQEIDPNTGEVRPNSHEETVSLGESKMSYTYICSPETMISFPSTISDGTFRKMLEFRIKSANEYLERHDQTVLGDIMRHFWNDEYCRQHSEIFTDGWWIDNPLAPALDSVHPIVADIKRIPDENGGRKYAVTFNCQGNIAEAMRIAKKQERAERRQEKKSGRKIKAMVV